MYAGSRRGSFDVIKDTGSMQDQTYASREVQLAAGSNNKCCGSRLTTGQAAADAVDRSAGRMSQKNVRS